MCKLFLRFSWQCVLPYYRKDDLFVNDSKTEHTVIKKGNKVTEKWRTVTKLGSQLGDSEDI